LDLDASDFDNDDLAAVVAAIVEYLRSLECLVLSEEMSQQVRSHFSNASPA
jgi:hypothetical protein